MEKNTLSMFNEEFENEKTGEKVPGVTIIIDGKVRQVMDILIENNKEYSNYMEVIKDALFEGIDQMIQKIKSNKYI